MSVRISRPQSLAEELANSITHGAGLVAAVIASPALIVAASARHDPLHIAGAVIFGATLVLCYLASTLYHAVSHVRFKRLLRVIDHASIFLFIAGTYTPFALGALRGPVGWALLAVVWTLAAAGIVLKLRIGLGHPRLSNAVYLGMGWLAILVARPLLAAIGVDGFVWLGAGGVAYTAGVAIYARDTRIRFGHAAWHLCVAAGSACHYVAVVRHAFPA